MSENEAPKDAGDLSLDPGSSMSSKVARLGIILGLLVVVIVYREPVFGRVFDLFGEDHRGLATVLIFLVLSLALQVALVDLLTLIGLSSKLGMSIVQSAAMIFDKIGKFLLGSAAAGKVASGTALVAPVVVLSSFLGYISIEECEEWCDSEIAEIEDHHAGEISGFEDRIAGLDWEIRVCEGKGDSAKVSEGEIIWKLPPVETVLARVAVLIEDRFSGPDGQLEQNPHVAELARTARSLAVCSERLAGLREERDSLASVVASLGQRCDVALETCSANFRDYVAVIGDANQRLGSVVSGQQRFIGVQQKTLEGMAENIGKIEGGLTTVQNGTEQVCRGVTHLEQFGVSQANRGPVKRLKAVFGKAGASASSPQCASDG